MNLGQIGAFKIRLGIWMVAICLPILIIQQAVENYSTSQPQQGACHVEF